MFCTKDAGVPIKSYSPELIVHPVLQASNEQECGDPEESISAFTKWQHSLTSVIVGPGLGRDPFLVTRVVAPIIRILGEANLADSRLNLIIDADGINLITAHPDVLRPHSRTVITPNAVEFKRIWKAVMGCDEAPQVSCEPDLTPLSEVPLDDPGALPVVMLAEKLGITVLLKVLPTQGPCDLISNGLSTLKVNVPSSSKRVGGQGDLLTGCLATTMHLANKQGQPILTAAAAASILTRTAARHAFVEKGWSLTCPDILAAFPVALAECLASP